MTPLDHCRQSLAEIGTEIAAALPPGRVRTLFALLHAGEAVGRTDDSPQVARPGWNIALRLCVERHDDTDTDCDADSATRTAQIKRFLADCDQLAHAYLVLAHCASGHLQLQQRTPRTFVAWATSRRLSTEGRERTDLDWWAADVARQAAPRLTALLREGAPPPDSAGNAGGDATANRYYRHLGQAYVARFSWQHSYPADAEIGDVTFGMYTDILALLIGWWYRERDHRTLADDSTPALWHEREVIAALANALPADPAVVGRAIQPFILDSDNAAYHSTPPGRAAPPLIRLDAGRVVPSAHGLLSEPLIFLARELRRRHAQEYHNTAYLREEVFRHDLYRLFSDRRFALSAGRVELKRRGAARTDLDALIFDRKTATLGIFELKAQDPFARSVEERQRQRDNFFHANRQVSAILEWVQRHGPDDVLARFDERTAKRFHVQKVLVFVLGRYTAHFAGGPEADRRAAWGSWAQVLQIVEHRVFTPDSRNPLGTVFARLHDSPPPSAPTDADSQTITMGDFRLQVYPSFADIRSEENHLT